MLNLPPQPEPEERPLSPSGAPYPEKSPLDQKIGQLARWMGQPEQAIMSAGNPLAMVRAGEIMGPLKLRRLVEEYRRAGTEWPVVGAGAQGKVMRIPDAVTAAHGMPPGLTLKQQYTSGLGEGVSLDTMQQGGPGMQKPYVGSVVEAKTDLPRVDPQHNPILAYRQNRIQPRDVRESYTFSKYVEPNSETAREPIPVDKLRELAAWATRKGVLLNDVPPSSSNLWNRGGSPVVMDAGNMELYAKLPPNAKRQFIVPQAGEEKDLHRANMQELFPYGMQGARANFRAAGVGQ